MGNQSSDKETRPRTSGPPGDPVSSSSSSLSALDSKDIFRQLIADEVRNGRLTPARRRRIICYAASLGMSAVEAGQLIAACRKRMINSSDPAERYHALRLVEPEPQRIPLALKISTVIVLAVLADLLLIFFLA